MLCKLGIKIFLTFLLIGGMSCTNVSYSIYDITSDNLFDKLSLTSDFGRIQDFGLDDFEPWHQYFASPESLSSTGEYTVKKYSNGNRRVVTITEYKTKTWFEIHYSDQNVPFIEIDNSDVLFHQHAGIEYGQQLIDFLLKDKQYVYKKTERIGGLDRLMKKVDDGFLVCTIFKTDDRIDNLQFQVYKTK